MNKNEFVKLSEKIANGSASDDEILVYNNICDQYQYFPANMPISEGELYRMKEDGLRRFWNVYKPNLATPHTKWFKVAAAILIFALSSIIYMWRNSNSSHRILKQVEYENKGKSGKSGISGAILTLSNGKIVNLNSNSIGFLTTDHIKVVSDKGQLVYIPTSNSSPDIFNILRTLNGEQYSVVLSDGSIVWLNAGSTLKYPTVFAKSGERRVSLTGEAYFQVNKDRYRPFIVQTIYQKVTVLGTHFNINAYNDDDRVKTTLFIGSVKINTDRGNKVVLIPGQESSVFADSHIAVKNASNGLNSPAWKSGLFEFENTNIEMVMSELARWYNVTVNYKGNFKDEKFTGQIHRDLSLNDILPMLEKSDLHISLKGREVTIYK